MDLGSGLTVVLFGLPVIQLIGFALCSLYIKLQIYRNNRIRLKYVKDCAKMKEITSIVFDKI